MRHAIALICALFLAAPAARAGESADLFAKHAYAGTLAEGDKALAAKAEAGDAEAKAARGALRFLMAIERLAQALHRHGLETPTGGPMMNLPILRIPVPPNPAPAKLDYAGFRAILDTLVKDLDAAESELAGTGDAEIKLPADLMKIALDLDGNGKADAYEPLGAILGAMTGGQVPPEIGVSFDTADMYWLRGYGNFIGGFAQFLLAHDFHDLFDRTFHLYFPNAQLPYAEALRRPLGGSPWSDPAIGDAVAFIHLINWPVAEPERLSNARARLKAMAAMSRASWAAARRETDNDREWLPNGKQDGALAPAPVSDGMIDGWLRVMDEFEAVLDGKKLMPHWRFDKGLNVKRMFEESEGFDLVLLIAGAGAVPWLEDGPVSSTADWDGLMSVFGGNFAGYAMWFN